MKRLFRNIIILFIIMMPFSIYAGTDVGVLYRNVYLAKPLSIADDIVFFEIFYDNIISEKEKYNNIITPKIFMYNLKTKEDEEIFNLRHGERALEIISEDNQISLLTYDRTRNISLYTRFKNGLITKKFVGKSNINPYTVKLKNKIYVCYEDSYEKDFIGTKFVCIDISGDIRIIGESRLEEKSELYTGEYLSAIGGNENLIFVSKINMKDGNFDGKNVISNIYCYDIMTNKFCDTGLKYNFLVKSISGNYDYIVVDKYDKDNPNEMTMNIYNRKDRVNTVVPQNTNTLGINNIYGNGNKFIIDAYKGIYSLNTEKKILEVVDETQDCDRVVLNQSQNIFIYKYFPTKLFFEIRSI